MPSSENMECCPVEYTISVIGGKYKPLLLWHLQEKPLRFNQLRKRVPHATAKMLTQHLRELEADGIVVREIFPVIPPKVEYSLTELGQSIMPVLQAMCDWGLGHRSRAVKSDKTKTVQKAV